MKTTVNPVELEKFKMHADSWWDKDGPLKTLHDINPTRLEFIKQHGSIEGLRILDVGCGGGLLSESLARGGASVVGLDAEESAIFSALRHAQGENLSLEYVFSPIEAYTSASFDMITCMELLEHVDDFELIIAHAARLLKPEGWFFVSTMNRTLKAYASVILAAEYILSILPRQTHDFKQFIRPSELLRAMRRHGFECITLKGMRYNPWTRKASLCDETDVNYLVAARLSKY